VYHPPALQLPAVLHDNETTSLKMDPVVRAAMPGTGTALCQVPFTSLTTNGSESDELPRYHPPALQLPAEAHDTELTCTLSPKLRAAVPGISMALCQVPFTSLTTISCS